MYDVPTDNSIESINPLKLLKSSSRYKNSVIISYLNINSIRNKLDAVADIILQDVDILCIAESKLDSSFSTGQFSVSGFKQPIRLDVSDKSGGLLIYSKINLPFRRLDCPVVKDDIQCIVSELNLRKCKWLVLSIYRNPKQNLGYFLDEITNILDFYSNEYDNLIIMGDFNEEVTQFDMHNFISNFDLVSLLKQPTCYKSNNGRCIDLILTNKNRSFQKSGSYETGISDHHHLIYTMFKLTYEKSPPKIINYRSFRNFSLEIFRKDLTNALANCIPGDLDSFNLILESVLDAHAPKKRRTVRGNHKPHLTKTLRKGIMLRSFYKNKANKTGDEYFYNLYKKQRNHIVNLNRQAKKLNFLNMGTSSNFWKSTKPLFSKKSHVHESFLLQDNGVIIKDEQHISQIFNSFFVNIVDSLNITPWEPSPQEIWGAETSIDWIVRKYRNHPSITSIASLNTGESFCFSNVTSDQVNRVIQDLNPRKSVSGALPLKVIKMVADIVSGPIATCLNTSLNSGIFPQNLKLAEVTPIFKKGDKFLKENYRPISILSCLSKIFEKIIFNQLSGYFDNILNSQLCGFRSKHNTQHALIRMIGQWHQCLDKSGKVGSILMDLSKAFDCIDHDLLIAKLAAYGLNHQSLKLFKCYLSNRFQRTKIGSCCSSWLLILKGVPQGSILGPLLFNIFINDLLSIVNKTDICNFADDNTIYSCASSLEEVISNLKDDLSDILSWFKVNGLAANPKKFQML